jgi:capsular polysaccharide transport system permease protein
LNSPTQQFRDPNLWDALRVQWNVIVAMMLREMLLRYKTSKLGYLWSIIDPSLQIAVWYVIYMVMRSSIGFHDMPMPLFLGTGIIAFFCFQNVSKYVMGAIKSSRVLLQFPMVKQIDAFISRFILESCTVLVVGCLTLALVILFGYGFFPRDSMGVLSAAFSLLLLALGFGAFNAMLISLWSVYEKLVPILNRFLFFTSGAFVPVEHLPLAAREYLQWNPVLNGVELLRESWSYVYDPSMDYSRGYILLWAGCFFMIALLLEKRVLQEELGE